MIYNPELMKEILKVTCSILQDHFFYEREQILRFMDDITDEIARELKFFERCANQEVVSKLHKDEKARIHFTCYFTSVNLRQVFIEKMHFSEQELKAFESILPKYTGEKFHEIKQKRTRTNHRKFFK